MRSLLALVACCLRGCAGDVKTTDDSTRVKADDRLKDWVMDYVRCLHGAAAHLVFDEPDCFVVVDDRNRLWLCHPITEVQLSYYSADGDAIKVRSVHHAAMRQGFEAITSQALLKCGDPAELSRRLAACP